MHLSRILSMSQQQQQQHLMVDENQQCPSIFSVSNHQLQPISVPNQPLFQNPNHQPHHHHHLFGQPVDQEPADPICNPFFPINFKPGLDQINAAIGKSSALSEAAAEEGEEEVGQEEDAAAGDASLKILHSPSHPGFWHSQGDSPMKEAFCKQLNPQLCNRKNKRQNEGGEEVELEANRSKCYRPSEPAAPSLDNDNGRAKILGNQYGAFGELEAICSPAKVGGGETDKALEKAASEKSQKRKRKRVMRDCELSSLGSFFESLVKQLLNHQEALHRKFIEAIERIDQERVQRESDWRRLEAARLDEEANARAQQQAMDSSRETAILTYLEKITGQKVVLPIGARTQWSQLQPQIPKEPPAK